MKASVLISMCSWYLILYYTQHSYKFEEKMDKKREREESVEFETIESILSPAKVARLHGYITSLSPMKQTASNNNYFICEVRDASDSKRIVGFDESQRSSLKEDNRPVTIESCAVKKSKFGDKMEVLVTRKTAISLEFGNQVGSSTSVVQPERFDCKNIQDLADFEMVSLPAKVLQKQTSIEVKPALFKQDVLLADASGSSSHCGKPR